MIDLIEENLATIAFSILFYILGIVSKVGSVLLTDSARKMIEKAKNKKHYKEIEKKHPSLIKEIRKKLIENQDKIPRKLIIKSSKTTYQNYNEFFIECHTDVHDNLQNIMLSLQELGVVSELKTNEFRLNKDFANYLIKREKN